MHPSPVNLVKEFEEFTHKKHEQKHLEEGNQNPGNGGGRSGSGDGTESENVNQLHTLLLSSTGGPEVVDPETAAASTTTTTTAAAGGVTSSVDNLSTTVVAVAPHHEALTSPTQKRGALLSLPQEDGRSIFRFWSHPLASLDKA